MTRYGIPHEVAHVIPDDEPDLPARVFLMQLPDGQPVVLDDSAALIWLLAAEGEEDLVGAMADLVGQQGHEIAADVTTFLDELVSRGLLIHDHPG